LPISCSPGVDGSTEGLGVLTCRVAGVRAGNETLRAPASYFSRIHTIDPGGGGCGRGMPGAGGGPGCGAGGCHVLHSKSLATELHHGNAVVADRPARAGVLLVFAPSHSVTKVLAFARRWRQS